MDKVDHFHQFVAFFMDHLVKKITLHAHHHFSGKASLDLTIAQRPANDPAGATGIFPGILAIQADF
jgi:hypothetical protein